MKNLPLKLEALESLWLIIDSTDALLFEIPKRVIDIAEIESVVRRINEYEQDKEAIRALRSQLIQHHEESVDEGHYQRLAAGEMGCTTCTLIAKSEAL